MAARPSVKIEKTFTFKGQLRTWSNRYHFNGGTPADTTHWNTLFDAITAAEKAVFQNNVTLVRAIGYAAGSDIPVATKTYSLAGTATSAGVAMPGEVVALLRYSTTARTSKNHPVYLYNYFHGINGKTSGSYYNDLLLVAQKTAIETYAAAWISGFSDGTITAVRAGPNGATATGYFVEQYLTHRDFPYTRSA